MEIQVFPNGVAKLPILSTLGNLKPANRPDQAVTKGQLESNLFGGGAILNPKFGSLVTGQAVINNHSAVAIPTTAAGTLATVTSGVIAGLISSTSVAAVTLTLDSVANITAAFALNGITIGAGTELQFIVDNTAGASTITLAVDAGATIAVATSVLTGGSTLTVSTANKIGVFQLYIYSATNAILSRIA